MSVRLTPTFFFPDYKAKDIVEMQYQLLKYRGMQPNPLLDAITLIFFYRRLEKDKQQKQLDPFMYKYSLQPSN